MHANLCGIHKLSYHFVVKKLLNNCGKKSPSEALNGKLSATEAKAKFKSLHDAYRRIINTESLASGSERPTKKSKWQHYDNLSFLRDSCLRKPELMLMMTRLLLLMEMQKKIDSKVKKINSKTIIKNKAQIKEILTQHLIELLMLFVKEINRHQLLCLILRKTTKWTQLCP
ncbi:uncharacterized protein LOC143893544 isoform X3 [Temnothorax americanus]|uniref:uncharacterized protein LOC143893544 isoform X3 n=1 Tax=Temnothorax americanus TaxID=1964332 RepID=UPI004067EB82